MNNKPIEHKRKNYKKLHRMADEITQHFMGGNVHRLQQMRRNPNGPNPLEEYTDMAGFGKEPFRDWIYNYLKKNA